MGNKRGFCPLYWRETYMRYSDKNPLLFGGRFIHGHDQRHFF